MNDGSLAAWIIGAPILAMIPAYIAYRKGHRAFMLWIAAIFLWPLAMAAALFTQPNWRTIAERERREARERAAAFKELDERDAREKAQAEAAATEAAERAARKKAEADRKARLRRPWLTSGG